MVLLAAFGRMEAGLKMADVAMALQRRFGDGSSRAATEFVYYAMTHHWRSHLREAVPALEEAARVGLDHGDLDGAISCRQIVGLAVSFCGMPLPEASLALDESERLMGRFRQGWYFECNAMRKHALRALDGGTEPPVRYAGGPFDPDVYVQEAMAEGDMTSVAMFRVHEAFVGFILGDRAEALVAARSVERHMEAVLGTFYVPLHALLLALGLCHEARHQPDRSAGLVRKALKAARSLRTAAQRAPENYLAMWLLVQAEALRARGRGYEAIPAYEQARRVADEHAWRWLSALAGELLAEVLAEGGSAQLAEVALWDACYAWRRWGALAKVARLEREHPELVTRAARVQAPLRSASTTVHTTTGSRAGDRLDLETILKTSQTLSEQLVLAELLERMMAAVLENAAAQRGLLLSRRGGSWQVDVERCVDDALAPASAGGFAHDVVQYVARTGAVVVLADATTSTDFASDPYLRRERPRSLLCIALEHRGEQTGILYLEHRDSTDAFTEDRVEVLRMLCGQIAISIENARLFAEQERVNRAYERFVPREFLGLLGKESIVDVELGDQVEREMTVLFSDVRGFTALSETMSPAENFAFINEFLSMMEPVFSRFSGFVDKYIGDAIMALFPTGADDALAAAVGMVRELDRLNARRAEQDLPAVRIGIGLNSGLLMLGTVGGPDRMDGTVISDAVNLASRVEGLTRVFGSTILISERTYSHLRNPGAFEVRSIGRVRVKGKATPVSVMEVLDGEPRESRELKRETLADFDEALASYLRRDFEQAAALFGSVLRWNPGDAVAARYLSRSSRFAEQGVADGWDGVEDMDSK
jgi:class 3 adenylate cyclase/tetratricopeptide (TPR) repeat protein